MTKGWKHYPTDHDEARTFPAYLKFLGKIHYFLLQNIVCRATGLLFVERVEGLENLPPNGPFLVVPNHGSFVDFMLVMDCLRRRRFLTFFIKKKYFDMKIWNRVLVWMCQIRADKYSIKNALNVLSTGYPVILFAEGTRTLTGEVGNAYPGLAMVGSMAKVPIIPMGINGAYEFWPWNKRFPNLLYGKKISVTFGEPVFFEQFADREEFMEKVMDEVKRLAK